MECGIAKAGAKGLECLKRRLGYGPHWVGVPLRVWSGVQAPSHLHRPSARGAQDRQGMGLGWGRLVALFAQGTGRTQGLSGCAE